jgi:phosphoglycolate phosphatase-like HAD superfamily hydrolase/ADP-ribose pyrophosphatase YjhB (NUDIX family)
MVAVIRNVLFDWSGTLVDDLGAVVEATNAVLTRAGRNPLSREQFREEFALPFTGFYQRHTPHVPMEQLEAWFHARFREVQDQVTALPHARGFLEFCRGRGLRTGLLSTMHPEHFAVQAKANGFDRFLDHVHLGIWDKREKIAAILKEHGWRPEETVYIGDMEHDVETARSVGMGSVGVLTGYNSSDRLHRAGPDLVVEHLGELQWRMEAGGLEWPPSVTSPVGSGASRRPVVTVGAAVFDADGRVLMLRTHKWSGKWGIPGGKMEFGEPAEEALRRELREETQLMVDDIRFVLVQDCIRSPEFYRDDHFVLLNYRCRAIAVDGVRLNGEAQEFRWVRPEEALGMDLNGPTRVLLEEIRNRGWA